MYDRYTVLLDEKDLNRGTQKDKDISVVHVHDFHSLDEQNMERKGGNK